MFFHILDDQNRRQKVFVDVFLPQTRLDFLNTGLLYINIGISCLFWPLTITISPTLRSQSPSILYSLHKISNKITISNHTTKAKRRKKKKSPKYWNKKSNHLAIDEVIGAQRISAIEMAELRGVGEGTSIPCDDIKEIYGGRELFGDMREGRISRGGTVWRAFRVVEASGGVMFWLCRVSMIGGVKG